MYGLGQQPSAAQLIAMVPGGNQLITYLKAEVGAAAKEAVKPYVMTAVAVGGIGAVLGLTALLVSIARR